MPGKRHRWEFMLMPQDDPAAITQPDRIYELLRPWNIDPAESTIERAVVYTFHSALPPNGGSASYVCARWPARRDLNRHPASGYPGAS
jgi:hypothetical protein